MIPNVANVVKLHNITLRLYYVTFILCYMMLCCVALHFVTSRHELLCCVLCYSLLRYVMCYVIVGYVTFCRI